MQKTLLVILIGILMLSIASLVTDIARGDVRSDAYPTDVDKTAGVWRSFPDYLDHVLWVPGVSASHCSHGVIHLGDELYQIPDGVSVFWCQA